MHPGATEVCDPADVDEDCSGSADDADPDVTGLFAFFLDRDLDGYGDPDAPVYQCDAVAGVTPDDQDCDDDDLDVSPAGTETCNGRDDDCDSVVDEGMVDGDGDGTCDAVDPCPDDNPDDLNRDGICDSSFSLVALGLAPGRTATVLVSHAPPGQRVYVAATLSGGSSGPCLFTTGGGLLCVELSSPRLLGSAVADTHGSAFLQVAVPSSLPSGATARLQGVSLVDVGALTPVFTVEVP
ncbi:MAG: hypothetical protein H6733_16340 [Alphaproteobacteria bacterium]|nr:hypothetical protein [Alphaproteobacteria bacterium]